MQARDALKYGTVFHYMGKIVMQSHTHSRTIGLLALVVCSLLKIGSVSAQPVEVSLPVLVEDVGTTIQVPVSVNDLSQKGVTTYYLKIQYDSEILDFTKSIITNTLSQVDGAGKFDGTNTEGEFTVAYAAPATRPLAGEGTLILLEANVLAAGTTSISFLEMQFNDDNVPSKTYDGLFSTETIAIADLRVSLETSSSIILTGESFTLTASLANHGQDSAPDVATVIELPSSVDFESASQGCMHVDGTVTCETAVLANTESLAHTLTLTAPSTSQIIDISTSASSSAVEANPGDNSASLSLSVESDRDGVPDGVEASVPNLNGDGMGDGNGDGIPDSEQENVASLPNGTDGDYVTVAAPEGSGLSNVSFHETAPSGLPASVELPDGLLTFELEVEAGAASVVTIYTTKSPNAFVKFGPTPENSASHWYEFTYDGTTGAQIFSDRIELHLVDGGRGDADLAVNGVIVDPSAVALSSNQAPSAAADAYEIDEDEPLNVGVEEGVMTNDSDPNGDQLYVSVVSSVEHGSLSLEADGSFSYVPDENYNGIDSFTYILTDGLLSDEATVTISINAVNDAPYPSAIETSAASGTLVVGGETPAGSVEGDAEILTLTWTEVTDPDGDDIFYMLNIAADAEFDEMLAEIDVTNETEVTFTAAELAAWLDSIVEVVDFGADATVYLRIITSDEEAQTTGDTESLNLVRGSITSIESLEIPETFALKGNYPNPFNPSTSVSFDIPEAAQVSIDIFDSLGRRVYRVPAQSVGAGAGRSIAIDASSLPSGAYVYRVIARMNQETAVASGMMTLAK